MLTFREMNATKTVILMSHSRIHLKLDQWLIFRFLYLVAAVPHPTIATTNGQEATDLCNSSQPTTARQWRAIYLIANGMRACHALNLF